MRMWRQERDANDCGPACIVALYAARQQIDQREKVPTKVIYQKYSRDEINHKGTTLRQHQQVLRELGFRTEKFSTDGIRQRLNKSEQINPILARVGRYDIPESHFITIADKTIYRNGEEMIAFADPGSGNSHLVSVTDFLYRSHHEYLQII